MNTRPGIDAQAWAFRDPRVELIVGAMLTHRETGLLHLASKALISTTPPDDAAIRGILGAGSRQTTDVMRSARGIASAGHSIGQEPMSRWSDLVGALVERLVFELVGSREPAATHSVEVQLIENVWTGRDWTNPLDVLVDQRLAEVYECKHQARRLDQDDLNQLEDVARTARSEGKQCRPALATFDTGNAVRVVMSRLGLRGTVWFAHKDEILGLGDAPPYLNVT